MVTLRDNDGKTEPRKNRREGASPCEDSMSLLNYLTLDRHLIQYYNSQASRHEQSILYTLCEIT